MSRKEASPSKSLRDVFERTTPAAIRRAGANPETVAQIAAIQSRADRLKAIAREHYKRMYPLWVGQEITRLAIKRTGLSVSPTTAFDKALKAAQIDADAKQNVHARGVNRISLINSIATRLSNAAVRNAELNPLQPTKARTERLNRKNRMSQS